jgi:restriction system protein
MGPLLEGYSSGSERQISEVRHELGVEFGLTEEELAERLPSGLAKTFDNRVGWAATYLYRTGLLARPRRSVYRITERGPAVLAANPNRVDLSVLSQFPEFEEFRKPTGRRRRSPQLVSAADETATPEERIDAAYQELRQALAVELLERVHTMAPSGG